MLPMAKKIRHPVTIVAQTPGRAHAIRHELDRMGALSRRKGRVVKTNASPALVARAMRTSKRSRHLGGVLGPKRRARHRGTR